MSLIEHHNLNCGLDFITIDLPMYMLKFTRLGYLLAEDCLSNCHECTELTILKTSNILITYNQLNQSPK